MGKNHNFFLSKAKGLHFFFFSILNIINLTYKETHLNLIYQYQGVVENTMRGHCFEH